MKDHTVPEREPATQARPPKVIDLAKAVASSATIPVLDIVKRRMYRDWLRGSRPRSLRVVYGDPKPMRIDDVDDVLREQARKERAA